MKKLILLTFMLFTLFMLPSKGNAQDITSPQLMVVKFHADWCGSCKTIGSALIDLSNKLDGQPILFTKLNFTNNTTRHQANLLASALGIEKVVAENNSTGFMLVIDAETKQIKDKLIKTQTVKEMGNIIKANL